MIRRNVGSPRALACAVLLALSYSARAGILAEGSRHSRTDRLVCASVFHWYTSNGGQLTGPWRPLEGRPNWTGAPAWWKSQVKQMMAANIDVLFVHLIDSSETQRTNLFEALAELRAEGYSTPQIVPFLDPMITWFGEEIDLATEAGKDEFAAQYIRFFNQYYSKNTDPFADSFLLALDGRVALDTWHVKFNCLNLNAFARADLEVRLQAAFAAEHPLFNNGIYMITTAVNDPTLSFADEKIVQFELHEYYYAVVANGLTTIQVKPGYWDQNIRNPGFILPRNGGERYVQAWRSVNRNFARRVYIESWNEYDEGSGIYAGNTGPPYIHPGSGNTATDVWSAAGKPFEYIDTTASGARLFNDTPDLNASILSHAFPSEATLGATVPVSVLVRNTGDLKWSGIGGFRFKQRLKVGQTEFPSAGGVLNDAENETGLYGGIFRGRPVEFRFNITVPATPGIHETRWSMMRTPDSWFGEELVVRINVGDFSGVQNWGLNE